MQFYFRHIVAIIILSIAGTESTAQRRSDFVNVLDLRTTVENSRKIEATVFSDMGAWHAYALPASKQDYGSFIGPLLMDMSGEWLANTFSKLSIQEEGKTVRLDEAETSLTYYPGLIQQRLKVNDLEILLQLIFVSSREAMLQTKITNLSNKKRRISVSYSAETLMPGAEMKAFGNTVAVSFSKNRHQFHVSYITDLPVIINVSGNKYTASFENIELSKSFELQQIQAFFLHPEEKPAITTHYQFSKELKKNGQRWDGYIRNFLLHNRGLTPEKKTLAVKCMITLLTNWRSKAKDLLHDAVFPSINYQGFYGVWSWDSWKQAVGLAYFFPALARENIRCMFDYQDEYGMVPDCVYTRKNENNWRDTKPPLAAWAVWNVFQQTKDTHFIREMYPKLLKYHRWWYTNRDHDKNGLCEYGSTDGTRIAAAWESGMDNAVRFDSAVMMKNNAHAWSLNQESVDLNVYLQAEKIFLSKMASVLNIMSEAKQWNAEADELAAKINKEFFDARKGFYFDKSFQTGRLTEIEGTEGWIPLWARISSQKQAESVMNIMKDQNKFNTNVPLPTLAADHPQFDPMKGYWRGPVWIDQFYFGIVGLKNYGYRELAMELTNKLFLNGGGILSNDPINENYHPLTGNGLNARNFSWSAAHILMLLKENSVKN